MFNGEGKEMNEVDCPLFDDCKLLIKYIEEKSHSPQNEENPLKFYLKNFP